MGVVVSLVVTLVENSVPNKVTVTRGSSGLHA